MAADLGASPAGKDVRIIHVTFKCAFRFCVVAHQKDLAQIAAGAIEAVRRFGKGAYLVGARLEQSSEIAIFINSDNAAFIPGPGNQPSGAVKRESIDNVFTR